MQIKPEFVPQALRERDQWVLWKTVAKNDRPTKLPFQPTNHAAKTNDPETWCPFDVAVNCVSGSIEGIGYVFAESDPFVGIDLDGCRNPQSGEVATWAKEIILELDTYAEISPSLTGVKLWLVGKSPLDRGRKIEVDAPPVGDKMPAIEVYDRLRYFAVTGWRLRGPYEPQERQQQLEALCKRYFTAAPPPASAPFRSDDAVMQRAQKYLAKLPPAISGQGGHNAAFHAACVLVMGFGLDESQALSLMREWNQSCVPPWSERELVHKVQSAGKQPGERNYLRNTAPDRWNTIQIPRYTAKPEVLKPQPKIELLTDAASRYIENIKSGKTNLIDTGLPELDYAIGGGVERGEMIILAARPSHGKSAVALQCVHYWTEQGMPCALLSEEMSALALGKRSLQFLSNVPQEHWQTRVDDLESHLRTYREQRADCIVIEGCGSVDVVCQQIEQAVEQHKVECVVVDYVQLLRGEGKGRYEQITNVSVHLRQLTTRLKIVLIVLAQLNREIEKRNKFIPVPSDLKETGQLEQDADVIVFLVWPHRIDSKNPPHEYQMFISKNRNRPINEPAVVVRFDPSRQRLLQQEIKDNPNYNHEFDAFSTEAF